MIIKQTENQSYYLQFTKQQNTQKMTKLAFSLIIYSRTQRDCQNVLELSEVQATEVP